MKKRKGFLALLLTMLLCLTVFSAVPSAIKIPVHHFSAGEPLSTQIISAENAPEVSREDFQQEVLLAETYDDLTYTVKSDDTVEISGCSTSASGDLVIPDTIDGKPVTSIGIGAFWGCTKLTGITIPNSVTSIKAEAFYNCSGLTSIIIPDSVTSISSFMFSGCTALTSVTIPDTVTSIGKSVFSGCSSLTDLTLPPSIVSIADSLFDRCSSLTSITVPGCVTNIGDSAFNACTSLSSIIIPDSVTQIGESAFKGCTNLADVYYSGSESDWAAISVASNNTQLLNAAVHFDFKDCLSYLTYETKSDGTIEITGCSQSVTGMLEIPQTIDGRAVTSIGESAFLNCAGLTDITIPDSVTAIKSYAFKGCGALQRIVIPDSVTSIDWNAFEGCDALASVAIGNGVSSIDDSAFSGCNNLISVAIGSGVVSIGSEAFKDCSNLTSAAISDGVKSIGSSAFDGCGNLTRITIPNSVTSVGAGAFRYCSGLTSVTIGSGVVSLGSEAFMDCIRLNDVVIPSGVTSISDRVFKNCSSLTNIKIPDGVTSIGEEAFKDCSNLTSAAISDGVKSIGSSAFDGCSNLTHITIPNSVTSVGTGAFRYCSGLTSVTIGNSVVSLGSEAFMECGRLDDVVIPSGVTSISDRVFKNCGSLTNIKIPDGVTSIGEEAFIGCSNLTSVTIPDLVVFIGISAFEGCSSLTSITIPNNTTSIGSSAFKDCTNLTDVTIPKGISEISISMFENCSSLMNIIIPDNVTQIGESAFSRCTSLAAITIPDSVTVIGEGAFSQCSSLGNAIIGSRVASINGWAFSGCSNLASITIPDCVTYIGPSAFAACSNLTDIAIPDSVTSLGYGVFMHCSKLASIRLPSGITIIGKEMFKSCTSLTSIVIPHGVTTIEDGAFSFCSCLNGISIPTSVTSIGDAAFYYCYSLSSITIPDSVTSLGERAFQSCINLGSAVVGRGITSIGSNTFYGCKKLSSVTLADSITNISGGVFYECSSLSSVTIPSGITTINVCTFYLCSSLTSVIIPDNVTSINDYAFGGCTALIDLTVPTSVTNIGESAFKNCTRLADVYYAGSESDWNRITIGADNSSLTSATIHFTDIAAVDAFNRCIYQANSLQRTSYIPIASAQEDLAWETYCDRYVASAQENGLDKASALWDACELISDSFNNIKATYDFVMEPKDIYTAIIMNVLENDVAESVNLINSDYKKGMQSCSQFVSTVQTAMSTLYSIDIMSANDYQNLTAQQMKSLQDLTAAFFKSEYPDLVELGDVFTGVTKGIGIIGSIQDYYERVLSCMLVANMSDSLRQVVCQAYTDSRATGNLYLRAALADCVDIVTSSHAELVMKLVTEGISAIGEEAASYLITELFWNGVKGSINTLCPEVAILQAGFKTGKFISNALTNTDKITAQYSQMLAITDVKDLFDTTCAHLKADFLSAQTEKSAKAYLNAVDLLFAIRLKDCDTAYEFVKEVDSAFIGQFLGHDFSDQLEAIDMAKSRYTGSRLNVHTAWIDLLAEDYPGSGLYETYDAIRMSIIENVLSKKYTIACPVDVYVYDQNDGLVAYVEGQRVSSSADDITVIRNGDEKSLWFQDDSNYHIECVGNAAGTMDITVKEYSSDDVETRTVSLYDVPLESSLKYDMAADTETQTVPVYSLSAEDGSTIPQDYDSLAGDSVQYKLSVESGNLLQGNGLLSSAAVAENETVTLVAYVPEGYRFLYWEASDDSAVFGDVSQAITTVRMTNHDLAVWPVVEALGSDAFSLTLQQGDEGTISVQLTNNSSSATEVLYVLAAYGTSKELITSRTAAADLDPQQSICLYIPQEYLDRVSEVQAFVLESGTLRPLRGVWSRSY